MFEKVCKEGPDKISKLGGGLKNFEHNYNWLIKMYDIKDVCMQFDPEKMLCYNKASFTN